MTTEQKLITLFDRLTENAGDFRKIEAALPQAKARKPHHKQLLAAACALLVLGASLGGVFLREQIKPAPKPTEAGSSAAVPGKLRYKEPGDRRYASAADYTAAEGNTVGSQNTAPYKDGVTYIQRPAGYPENISDILAYFVEQEQDKNAQFRVEMSYMPPESYEVTTENGQTLLEVYKELVRIDLWQSYLPRWVYANFVEVFDVNATGGKDCAHSDKLPNPDGSETYGPLEWLCERPAFLESLPTFPEIDTEEKLREYALNGSFAKIFPEAKALAQWFYSTPSQPSQRAPHKYREMEQRLTRAIEVRAIELKEPYYPALKELGIAVRTAQLEAAKKIFAAHDLQSNPFSIQYSGRFVVTLSKEALLRFAKQYPDMHFWDLGAKERPKNAPENFSSELALEFDKLRKNDSLEVYVVYADCELLNHMNTSAYPPTAAQALQEKLYKKYGNPDDGGVRGLGDMFYLPETLAARAFRESGIRGHVYVGSYFFNEYLAVKRQLTRAEIAALAKNKDVLFATVAETFPKNGENGGATCAD